MDFRGGDRRINPYMAEYIKRVNEGQTEWQKKRELQQKAILYGAQAGLTGVAGLALGQRSREDAADRADAAKRQQYAKTPSPDYKPFADGASDGKVPAWLGERGAGDASQTRPVGEVESDTNLSLPTDALATQADANSQLNDAARDAAIGSWYTKPGLEKHAMTSSQLADDTGVARDEMNMGGMMNSLPRVPR